MNDIPSRLPLVSVIIPLYNKAPYVKRALDSVLTQTVQDFEVIVVNDGSKDGGEKIVEGYEDSRIHLINQENQGVSAARNRGVYAARAELVAFLDADDEWLPEFLEVMLMFTVQYPDCGMYFCNSWRSRGDELSIARNSHGWNDGLVTRYFKDCALFGHRIDTDTVVVRKSVFVLVGGFDSRFTFFEDYDLWDRIAFNSRLAYIAKPLAIYHTESSCAAKRISFCNKDFLLPFITYLETQPGDIVRCREDYSDILLYLDSLKFLSAGILVHYSKFEAVKCVLQVRSVKLLKKKYIVILIYLIPDILKKPLSKLYHTVFRHP